MIAALVALRNSHEDYYALRAAVCVGEPGNWILIWDTKTATSVSCMTRDGAGNWEELWCAPA